MRIVFLSVLPSSLSARIFLRTRTAPRPNGLCSGRASPGAARAALAGPDRPRLRGREGGCAPAGGGGAERRGGARRRELGRRRTDAPAADREARRHLGRARWTRL